MTLISLRQSDQGCSSCSQRCLYVQREDDESLDMPVCIRNICVTRVYVSISWRQCRRSTLPGAYNYIGWCMVAWAARALRRPTAAIDLYTVKTRPGFRQGAVRSACYLFHDDTGRLGKVSGGGDSFTPPSLRQTGHGETPIGTYECLQPLVFPVWS